VEVGSNKKENEGKDLGFGTMKRNDRESRSEQGKERYQRNTTPTPFLCVDKFCKIIVTILFPFDQLTTDLLKMVIYFFSST
jgi:hypothetical protein